MKAAVYYKNGGPEVLQYEDVPDPQCQPSDVLIEVKSISLEGGDAINRFQGPLVTSPHIVGYQASGNIIEVGSEVTNLQVGQRVTTTNLFGSHAQLRSVPWKEAWPIPDALSFEEASVIPIGFGTAHECLFWRGRLQKGETVLVQGGAGGVGINAIQLAKRAGARVIATASSDKKLDVLKDYGMDEGINYLEENVLERVKSLTDNKGINLVVDAVGGKVLQTSIDMLAYNGRVMNMGNVSRSDNRYTLDGLMPNRSITRVSLTPEMTTERVREMIAGLLDSVAKRELKVAIDRQFSLSEASSAHEYIESRQAIGRVIMIP